MTASVVRSRRLALALIVAGALAALLVQASWPGRRPPLYDGVVIEDPYEWLDPPPGYPGGAEGTSDTVDVVGGENRIVAVFTSEQPPQAQVLAQRGSLKVASGASSLTVTITPVEADVPPPDGYIDGNVYEIDVVDDLGNAAPPKRGSDVSVVLRPADDNDLDAAIETFDGTTWKPLKTGGGGPFAFEAVVPAFGDFALVAKGASPYPTAVDTGAPTEVPASVQPSEAVVATPSTPTIAPTSAPSPSPDTGMPVASIAAIVLGALGLVALVVLLRRPRRREDRWR